MTRSLVIVGAVIGIFAAAAASAQSDVQPAWTLLEQGAANANGETRIKAVSALGLLVKDDRARRLAESKLRDGEAAVRAARRPRSGKSA
jgi:hypothetical protein